MDHLTINDFVLASIRDVLSRHYDEAVVSYGLSGGRRRIWEKDNVKTIPQRYSISMRHLSGYGEEYKPCHIVRGLNFLDLDSRSLHKLYVPSFQCAYIQKHLEKIDRR